MDLIPIKDYENYSFDKNTNQIYSHNYNRFLTTNLRQGYYKIGLMKNCKRKHFLFHRLVYQAYYPDIDISKLCIDHIDNCKTNNNIENLRHCTKSQNGMNQKIHKNNSSGHKNIYLRNNNTYQVDIRKNQKKYTKTLKTLDEALEWKEIKLNELHGEFANLG